MYRIGAYIFYPLGVAAVALALPALAASFSPARAQSETPPSIAKEHVLYGARASKVIGSKVINHLDEDIGSVNELLIEDRRITHLVLSVGGFLGIGEKLVAVPYSELTIAKDGKIVIDLSKKALEDAAAFRYAEGRVLARKTDPTSEPEKDAYLDGTQREMKAWEKRIAELKNDAARMGDESKEQARARVDQAWTKMQGLWLNLKREGGEAWDRTKASFEDAKKDLDRAWNDASS